MGFPRLAGALLPLLLALSPPAGGVEQVQARSQAPAKSSASVVSKPALLQRIRQLLGLNPPIAVGGSRGAAGRTLCVLSLQVERQAAGQAEALVPIAAPTLLVAEPLAELRLESPQGRILWRRQASSAQAIVGPIAWPLAPLQPAVPVVLQARPLGVSGADAAMLVIRAAPAVELARHQAAMQAAQGHPEAWLALIRAASDADQLAMLRALIVEPSAPASPALLAMRAALSASPCR